MLTNKTTFYVSHTSKSFVAIVQEGLSKDTSGIGIPPVVLLPQK
jgi:hypothetical protein